jgi:hypothetical protein
MYFTTTEEINDINKVEYLFLDGKSEYDVLRHYVFLIRYNPHIRMKFKYDPGTIIYIPIQELKEEIQILK